MPYFGFLDLSELLTTIGTVLTAIWTWVSGALGALETSIADSFLLQMAIGIAVAFISIKLLSKIAKMVVAFIRK